MASKNKPGGGWKNGVLLTDDRICNFRSYLGAGAQEENLHRRTNLCQCLEDPYHEFDSVRSEEYHVPEVNRKFCSYVNIQLDLVVVRWNVFS